MVRLLTRMPSLSSSPRMRSAPQRRFRRAMSWISPTISGCTGARPGGFRERRRQNRRDASRCQRGSVSGWTRRSTWRDVLCLVRRLNDLGREVELKPAAWSFSIGLQLADLGLDGP